MYLMGGRALCRQGRSDQFRTAVLHFIRTGTTDGKNDKCPKPESPCGKTESTSGKAECTSGKAECTSGKAESTSGKTDCCKGDGPPKPDPTCGAAKSGSTCPPGSSATTSTPTGSTSATTKSTSSSTKPKSDPAMDLPPCPPRPCPPFPTRLCPPNPDPNNPCNYCPPPCIDPDAPNLVKLKKLQCHFQSNQHIPIHLRGGTADALLCQFTYILTFVGFFVALYGAYCLEKK